MPGEQEDKLLRAQQGRETAARTKRERTQAAVRGAVHEVVVRDTPLLDVRFEDVADRAGVTRTSVFNHFPAKEDLIVETVRHDLGERMETIFGDTEAPQLRRRLTAARTLLDYSFNNPALAKHMATVISDFPNRDFISPHFDASLQASGVIDPNLSRLQSRILTMTILQAGVEQPRQGDQTEYRNVVRHRINQMVMHGFSAAPQV